MSSSSTESDASKKNALSGLRRAVAFAQEQANDEKEIRIRTIKTLVCARDALLPVFGADGDFVQRLQRAIIAMTRSLACEDNPILLIGEIARLARTLEIANGASPVELRSSPSQPPKTSSVFVIHGHDELNRRRLVEMLRAEFGLNPVVILSQPGKSQTTIEKFEEHASACSYAISLLTADDSVTNETSGSCLQARPNVIFETGWFAGRLGRERVLILLEESVRIHSDIEGINQHRFKD